MSQKENRSKTQNKREMRTAHVVSHTHWDREWRYPLWETHLMLVDFMDELVEVLESDTYPGFLLDGQVIPVLDYLEIRPQMRDRVKALVASGKLQVGPWYTLPDEYPIDGESMVRNLLVGYRRARELGGVFEVGYTSFGWGQTAQLPQIYAGFGMDIAMIGKHVGRHRAPKSEFIWRAPDGSELLTTRFGEWGRANFYLKIHLSALFGVNHEDRGWCYYWKDGGIAYHRADVEQMEQDHFRLDAPVRWYPEYITAEICEKAWKTTDESVLENDRLMMNGCDYTASQPMFPEMLARLNEVDADNQRQWVHTIMPEFVKLMRQKIDCSKLVVVEGELRDGPAQHVSGNALTTRLYVKQLNKQAENMLIRYAEPLCMMVAMLGVHYEKPLLDKAWDFLLKSHAHDSINGVTQDKTVTDVIYSLTQVIDISQALGNRAMQELVKRIDTSNFKDEDVLIVVFNPLPYARREVLEAWVNMPFKPRYDRFWAHEPEGIQIFDACGEPVSTQCQGYTNENYVVAELHTRAFPYYCERYRIFFDTGEIPAGGYKIFRAAAVKERRGNSIVWSDSMARTGSLLKSPNSMENEFVRVEMNPNGTFDLTDKVSGRRFCGLNYYEDRGEHGDYWINTRPMFDQVHTSLGCAARIWSTESGPLYARLISEVTMRVPRYGMKERQRRSDELADLTIRTSLTMRAGERHVEVNVEFDNKHEDHYLRAMFPTGISNATHADSGGHFVVNHRPVRPQGPTPKSIWPEMGTLPQNMFIDVSDGETGLAFINDSLTEYEVLDNEFRTVALSLLRSVCNYICTELRVGSTFPSQKGGQSLGHHSIRYAIRPHSGTWQAADIPLAAEKFNVACRPVQTRAHTGTLPVNQASLFEISNSTLRFSALKKCEDRDTFVARIYNPTNVQQAGILKFHAPLKRTWLVNLNEDRLEEITITNGNGVSLNAGAAKIVTVELEIK